MDCIIEDWASQYEQSMKSKTESTWAKEYIEIEQRINDDKEQDDPTSLKQAAEAVYAIANESNDSKLKNSKFMGLMEQIKDSKVTIEGNNLVSSGSPMIRAQEWARSFGTKLNTNSWEEVWDQHSNERERAIPNPVRRSQTWIEEYQQYPEPLKSFESNNSKASTIDDADYKIMEQAFKDYYGANDWVQTYRRNIAHLSQDPQDLEWEKLEKNWISKSITNNGYRALNPVYKNYQFEEHNPYVDNEKSPALNADSHNTTRAILVLEAILRRNPDDAISWSRLGLCHQENETDSSAIAAFRQALSRNPHSLESWIALAVSYANENCREDAYDALESWIKYHPKYSHLFVGHKDSDSQSYRHAYLSRLLITAARENAHDLNPDIQTALGVLFNISEEWDKAVDCFRAALSKRPEVCQWRI